MKRTGKQFLRRGVSTLLALLLAAQALPAALAASDISEDGASSENPDIGVLDTVGEDSGMESQEIVPEDGTPSSVTPDAGSNGMSTDGEEDENMEEDVLLAEENIETETLKTENISKTANDSVTWTYDSETKTAIISGTGETKDLTSNNYLGLTYGDVEILKVEENVTGLGKNLLRGMAKLTEVSLPSTLELINEKAFNECTSLETITIPSSVTSLGRCAFMGCTALKEVTWNNADVYKPYTIGDQVFSKTKLAKLELPALTTLTPNKTNGPFTGCPDTLWTSGGVTFAGTEEQWQEILKMANTGIPTGDNVRVTCLGTAPLKPEGSDEPKPVEVPYTGKVGDNITWTYDPTTKTLTLAGTGETYNYPSSIPPWYNKKGDETDFQVNLTKVVIGEGITKIGDRLFINAGKLTDVTFPSTLKEIAQKTFMNCTSLVSLDMSAAPIEILGANMFNGALALESITIPKALKEFGDSSFAKTNMADITYKGTIDEYKALANSGKASILQNEDYLVHCSDGNYIYGKNVMGDLTYTVISRVLALSGSGAIPANPTWRDNAEGATTLVLRPSITEIGENAFKNFTSLREICFVGDEAAWNSFKSTIKSGNDVLLSTPVRYIISGTCGDVSWSLSPDETVLTISGSGAMADYRSASQQPWRHSASSITTLVIENGVTTVGDYAFYGCKNLGSVSLPTSLDIVGTYSFSGCYALTSVTIPEGVRIIAAKAFSDTKYLKTIYFPSTLEAIDMKAFNYDTALKDVYYAGTAHRWSQLRITDSGAGNKNLRNATLHCTGTAATAAGIFSDVTGSEGFVSELDYLVEDGYLTGRTFNPDGSADLELVLSVLYRRAGEPGVYANAADWGKRNGLTTGISESLTRDDLCLVLARTAAYNGRLTLTGEAEAEQAAALSWAEDLGLTASIPAEGALTRAEAAVVLARYLQQSDSKADRHDQIIAAVRAALQNDGDGKMYILAPDLTETKKSAKTGDCTLIVFPQGATMLIDSGVNNSEANVLGMLRGLGLTRLDYFVLTHPHTDHAGNAVAVINYIYNNGGSVGQYYYSGYPAPDNKTTESDIADLMRAHNVPMDRNVHAGQSWTIDGVTVDVLGPTEAEVTSGNTADEFVNNVSILLKMTYGSSTYLTGGDLYISQELVIINRLGAQLKADVMKANHHGLYTSNSWEWLEAVSPLVMVTENDDVGNSAAAEAAPGRNIAYYSAGVDGDVLIVMDNARNYEVTAQYDTDLRKGYTGEIGLPDLPEDPDPVTPDPVPVVPSPGIPAPSVPVAPSSGNTGNSNSKDPVDPNEGGSVTTTKTDAATGTVTETTKAPDGSERVVETTTDGTVTTIATDAAGNKTATTEKPDGSAVTTVENKDGGASTTTVSADGQVTAFVTAPAAAVAAAQTGGQAVALPMPEVPLTADAAAAPVVTVTTGSSEPVKVEIPVEQTTPGTVAVIVNADGTEEVVKTSLATANGVTVTVADGATVKIVDNSKSFPDADAHWAGDAIAFATAHDLFNGTATDSFTPDGTMTRSMLITVLARYDGVDTSTGATWYEKGVEWAAANSISSGEDLEAPVSREQLATMLYRYAAAIGLSTAASGSLNGFPDAGSVSDYAAEAMAWAVGAGLIGGTDKGELNPGGSATRAEVATILMRFCENVVK